MWSLGIASIDGREREISEIVNGVCVDIEQEWSTVVGVRCHGMNE